MASITQADTVKSNLTHTQRLCRGTEGKLEPHEIKGLTESIDRDKSEEPPCVLRCSDGTGLIRRAQVMQVMLLAGEMDGKALKRCVMQINSESDLQNDLHWLSLGKLVYVTL